MFGNKPPPSQLGGFLTFQGTRRPLMTPAAGKSIFLGRQVVSYQSLLL